MMMDERTARRAIGRALAIFEDLAYRADQHLPDTHGSAASCALGKFRDAIRRMTQCLDLGRLRVRPGRLPRRWRYATRRISTYLDAAYTALKGFVPIAALARGLREAKDATAWLIAIFTDAVVADGKLPPRLTEGQLQLAGVTYHLFGGEPPQELALHGL